MDTKERHEMRDDREEAREARKQEGVYAGQPLLKEGKNRKRNGTRRTNRLWLWFGVLILVFILLWWLWSIGIFGDLNGTFNG